MKINYDKNVIKAVALMIVILIGSVVVSGWVNCVRAEDANFSWIPNNNTGITDPAAITIGYNIHYGVTSGNYSAIADQGNPDPVDGRTHGTVYDLEEGLTYYFAATAYSVSDESDFTPELSYAVPYTCRIEHLEMCTTETDCDVAGGYWWNDQCNTSPQPSEELVPPQDFKITVIVN